MIFERECKMIDVEKLSKDYTILQGDCRTTIPTIPDSSIDCIVTSPPYYDSGWDDYKLGDSMISTESNEEVYMKTICDLFAECKRVLKDTGTVWLVYNEKFFSTGFQHYLILRLIQMGWYLRREIIWSYKCKDTVNDKEIEYNSFEYIWCISKEWDVIKNKTGLFYNSVWVIDQEKLDGVDFCVMPLELAKQCIQIGSNENDIVMDLFSGSGTVGAASKICNRKFIGIELMPQCVEYANKRIQNI